MGLLSAASGCGSAEHGAAGIFQGLLSGKAGLWNLGIEVYGVQWTRNIDTFSSPYNLSYVISQLKAAGCPG